MAWLRSVNETFLDSAPVRLKCTFRIARPAAEVWEELTADNTLHWCRIISRIEWTSPRPYGVGTTRTAVLPGGLERLDETFFRWEEGRRKSFFVHNTRLPAFRAFAEDYLVEPQGESSSNFTWTIAFDPLIPPILSDPVNKRVLGSLFSDTRRHFGAD